AGGDVAKDGEQTIRSPKLPGGDLLTASFDRRVMELANRGQASGFVGDRWADLAASAAEAWVGTSLRQPGDELNGMVARAVIRLDERGDLVRLAARRGLQNPDLLVLGDMAGTGVRSILPADAKFSVETARSKQVSAEVVAGLVALPAFAREIEALGYGGATPVAGLFICPDSLLTRVALERGYGVVRTTVTASEVVTVPVAAGAFFAPVEGATIIPTLAGVDRLPVRPEDHLTLGLYYFRLARAAVGCWLDATAPLLVVGDRPGVDVAMVQRHVEGRTWEARSALELIVRWDADVGRIRRQREVVDRVVGAAMPNRDLRELVERRGLPPGTGPTLSTVRRHLNRWYRLTIRDRLGPMSPPVPDGEIEALLARIGRERLTMTAEVATEAIRLTTTPVEPEPDDDDEDNPIVTAGTPMA
ncbi:MAG: hypothetical protein H0U40_04600, partial [Chloroflexia bacterium]|nr:hypothetical protein [Chloroflexia bacterium]